MVELLHCIENERVHSARKLLLNDPSRTGTPVETQDWYLELIRSNIRCEAAISDEKLLLYMGAYKQLKIIGAYKHLKINYCYK